MVGPSLRFDEKLFDLKMAELLPQMYGLAVDDTPLREALTIQEGSEEAPRGAYEVQLIDRYFVRLREQLQGIDRIAREVWQIQGEAVTPGRRLAELRKCAESLTQSKSSNAEDDSLSQRLLVDLREVWPEAERHALTGDLLARLKAIEESPWAAEVELNPRKLARMLRGFGVSPSTVRADGRNGKGYSREEAEAAFSRYLSPETSHASQPA